MAKTRLVVHEPASPTAVVPKRRKGRAAVILFPDEPTSIPREEIDRAVRAVIAQRKKQKQS
jgi:hypothetical protein